MIRFYLFIFLGLTSISVFSQKNTGRKIYISKGADNGCMFMAGSAYKPGDTLVIRSASNPWDYIYLGGINGAPGKPVVIINEGVVEMKKGIALENCQYIKVTGSGSKERYGFRISGSPQVALVINGKSAHIEVERFFVKESMFGCWIKNEADCDTSINNWVLNDMSIHDFEMHQIAIEGFYMGSTDPNNFTRPKNCNGLQQFYKPSKLGNIKVYNGIIDGTGRPAIMLSNAQIGMSEIYNNVVRNVGREFNDQQGTGISIGGYTRAYVHHNTIKNTFTWGIASLGGSGLLRIENNQIDSSGYLDGRTLAWPQNIMIDTRPTKPVDSTRFIIRNNSVSNPGKNVKSIEVFSTLPTYVRENIICNNKTKGKAASISVAKGIRWQNCKGEATQQLSVQGVNQKKIIMAAVVGAAFLIGFLAYRRKKQTHLQNISLA